MPPVIWQRLIADPVLALVDAEVDPVVDVVEPVAEVDEAVPVVVPVPLVDEAVVLPLVAVVVAPVVDAPPVEDELVPPLPVVEPLLLQLAAPTALPTVKSATRPANWKERARMIKFSWAHHIRGWVTRLNCRSFARRGRWKRKRPGLAMTRDRGVWFVPM
jgi:hypothetical protein